MSLVEHIADVGERIRQRGPRKYLIRGQIPHPSYGAMAAPEKAQKTFGAMDMLVSVASGTPYLGHFPVDVSGPVVLFIGEGGEESAYRRLEAICESRGLILDELPIYIRSRSIHLQNDDHMRQFAEMIAEVLPVLVILDPFYLMAGGARLTSVTEVGALLERPQQICEEARCTLLIIHHFNRGEGRGSSRFSGAGLAEWGRVLFSIDVTGRYTDPNTMATTVTSTVDLIGGEIPDMSYTVKRVVRAEDPDDLNSPLDYSVEVFEKRARSIEDDMHPARRKVLEALEAQGAAGGQVPDLGDWIATEYGTGLRHETINRELAELHKAGLADSYGEGWSTTWFHHKPSEKAA